MLRLSERTVWGRMGLLPKLTRPCAVMAVAFALSGLLVILTQNAGAQGIGAVVGQVVNGTQDLTEADMSSGQSATTTPSEGAVSLPVGEGLPVRLRVMRGGTELDVVETRTDANGRFRLEGLDTEAELEYWPEVVYLGVSYPSAEPLRFEAGQVELPVTLTVYETTGDDSAIRIDSVHMIAESFGQVMRLTEIHLFGNTGDRTYVGTQDTASLSTTVLIPLPDQAVGLALEQETTPDQFVQADGSLRGTQPVPPGDGTSMAFFSYHVPVADQVVPLERTFAYPVVALNLLVTQPGLAVRSGQLQSRGLQSFQDRQFEFYAAQDIAPNSPLALEFALVAQPQAAPAGSQEMPGAGASSAVPAGSSRGDQALLRWLGYGLSILAVVGVIVYTIASRKSPPEQQEQPAGRAGR